MRKESQAEEWHNNLINFTKNLFFLLESLIILSVFFFASEKTGYIYLRYVYRFSLVVLSVYLADLLGNYILTTKTIINSKTLKTLENKRSFLFSTIVITFAVIIAIMISKIISGVVMNLN